MAVHSQDVTQAGPVGRVIGFVLGPPVRWVGSRVERRVREQAPDLPEPAGVDVAEPPPWVYPVGAVLWVVAVIGAQLLEDDRAGDQERRRSERAEPSASSEATAERCADPSDGAGDGEERVLEALETLGVEPPPEPTEEDVKAAYRERTIETHPDQGGDAEDFMAVREAWEMIEEEQDQDLSALSEDGDVTKQANTS